MAHMNRLTVPLPPVMKTMTVNVRLSGVKRMRARLLIASHLFELAAKVAGCKVSIEIEQDREEPTEWR